MPWKIWDKNLQKEQIKPTIESNLSDDERNDCSNTSNDINKETSEEIEQQEN